jgi:hypothetical protein
LSVRINPVALSTRLPAHLIYCYVSIVRRHVEAAFGEVYQPGTRWLDKFKRGHQAPALRLLAQYQEIPA